jgi:hypothetical protein
MSLTGETQKREQRRFRRMQLSLPAKFLVVGGDEEEGSLLDISPGGLALVADARPEITAPLVVYLDELGRVEGHVVRHLDNGFAMEFEATDAKRERLAARLSWLANRDDVDPIEMPRTPSPPTEKPRFILDDGREIECRVLDISVNGVWLQVDVRPAIGQEVTIGCMRGRISRHHPKGVAIEFLRSEP